MCVQAKEGTLASLQRDLEAEKAETAQACATLDAARDKWQEEQTKLVAQVRRFAADISVSCAGFTGPD